MYFCTEFEKNAQMAELVDALVSNTSAARHAGSIPALGTRSALEAMSFQGAFFLCSCGGRRGPSSGRWLKWLGRRRLRVGVVPATVGGQEGGH